MNYEIIEFIVNNREAINSLIDGEMAHSLVISRIFDNNHQIKDEFLKHRKLGILRNYISGHFNLNPEELLLIDEELFEFLKEKK